MLVNYPTAFLCLIEVANFSPPLTSIWLTLSFSFFFSPLSISRLKSLSPRSNHRYQVKVKAGSCPGDADNLSNLFKIVWSRVSIIRFTLCLPPCLLPSPSLSHEGGRYNLDV